MSFEYHNKIPIILHFEFKGSQFIIMFLMVSFLVNIIRFQITIT